MEKKFENTVLGLVSVLTKNSNHNSDFTSPRMVNGKLIATDKSLKHYVRHFLDANGDKVFYKKTCKVDGKINHIKDRVSNLNIKNIRDYFDIIDNKFFGFTILDVGALKAEFNGALQVTYANNIYSKNNYTSHTITSKFPSNDKNEQSTIGSEHKVDEANYVHYFNFFPKKMERDSLMSRKEMVNNIPYFTNDDVEKMKHAFSHCIGSSVDGSYTSASKSGTKIGLCIYVTLKENCRVNIDITNSITCDENIYNKYSLQKLYDLVSNNISHIEKVDIVYTEGCVDFAEPLPNDSIYKIHKTGYNY